MVSDAVIKSIKSVDGGTFTKYDDGVSWSIPQVYTDAWAQLLSKVWQQCWLAQAIDNVKCYTSGTFAPACVP